MKHFDLILRRGTATVLSANNELVVDTLDIGILDGKIAAIHLSPDSTSEKVIDCKGLHILPGIIDSQVHFRDPGLTHKEDLFTGTLSALYGGVTSIFEMPNTNPSTTTQKAFEEKIHLAETKAWVNYAFFIGASAENVSELCNLEKLPGCSGVKVFMGSSTGNLLVEEEELLEQVLVNTKRRLVVHAEDEKRLKERKQLAIDGGHSRFHPVWRDEETAFLATERLLKLAQKHKRQVHVLHVTTKKEIALLSQNKDIASFEILPQHLYFHAPDCYETLGNLAQMNPPIRELPHQQALWTAVQKGWVDVIATDHAPHTLDEKSRVYPNSPSGMPGVQTLVPLMLHFVNQGKISLTDFVRLTTLGPIKVFGMKNKGKIQVGADADLTLVDLKKQTTVDNKNMKTKCGWTPYHGAKLDGKVIGSIINGVHAFHEDTLLIQSPSGQKVLFS